MEKTKIQWRKPAEKLIMTLVALWLMTWFPGYLANTSLVESAVEDAVAWAAPEEEMAEARVEIPLADSSFLGRTRRMAENAWNATSETLESGVEAVHRGTYSGMEILLRGILKMLVFATAFVGLLLVAYLNAQEFIPSFFLDFLFSIFKRAFVG